MFQFSNLDKVYVIRQSDKADKKDLDKIEQHVRHEHILPVPKALIDTLNSMFLTAITK